MNIQDFRKIYDLYYSELCSYLNYYTQDSEIIEDVLQDVFLKLWENRDTVEIKYIKTYLFHTARNSMINTLRSEFNRNRMLEQWFVQQVQDLKTRDCFDINLFSLQINKAIERLPSKCREIFLLSRQKKMSYQEIATALNLSIKTVETQMGIALKRIRFFMNSSMKIIIIFIANIMHCL